MVENWRAGATEPNVATAKVLRAMDRDRTLFNKTGPNAIGAFQFFRPDGTKPTASEPVFVRLIPLSTMRDDHAAVVAKKHDIARVSQSSKEPVEFIARDGRHAIQGTASIG
jgi:hypothetical protein